MTSPFRSGLEGVIAAETRLSQVDGEHGQLILAGLPVEVLAPTATFEETLHLFWHHELPTAAQLSRLEDRLRRERQLPAATLALLEAAAQASVEPMEALRMGVASLSTGSESASSDRDAVRAVAAVPGIVAAYWRLLSGDKPLASRPDLSHVANYLYLLEGETPGVERVRALETYLNTVVDHGMNASTFTARVIISTGSDILSAIVGAIGALKGPLHGGAPGPALDMVFEIGEAQRAEAVIRRMLANGERLMGFGHRVYKVRDPRAEVLLTAAEQLAREGEDRRLHDLAREVEAVALRLLQEEKPGRRLHTNVEYYTALLLHCVGLPKELFTPSFAVGRVVGWAAHCFEQSATGRLIRPSCRYVGEVTSDWRPLSDR